MPPSPAAPKFTTSHAVAEILRAQSKEDLVGMLAPYILALTGLAGGTEFPAGRTLNADSTILETDYGTAVFLNGFNLTSGSIEEGGTFIAMGPGSVPEGVGTRTIGDRTQVLLSRTGNGEIMVVGGDTTAVVENFSTLLRMPSAPAVGRTFFVEDEELFVRYKGVAGEDKEAFEITGSGITDVDGRYIWIDAVDGFGVYENHDALAGSYAYALRNFAENRWQIRTASTEEGGVLLLYQDDHTSYSHPWADEITWLQASDDEPSAINDEGGVTRNITGNPDAWEKALSRADVGMQGVIDRLHATNSAIIRPGQVTALNPYGLGYEIVCSAAYIDLFLNGEHYVLQQDGVTIRAVHHCLAVPDASYDSDHGYSVGVLRTMDDGRVYRCDDASPAAAVWNLVEVEVLESSVMPEAGKLAKWGEVTSSEAIAVEVSGLTGDSEPYNGLYYPGPEHDGAPSWLMDGVLAPGDPGSIYWDSIDVSWGLATPGFTHAASGTEASDVGTLSWSADTPFNSQPVTTNIYSEVSIAGHTIPPGNARLVDEASLADSFSEMPEAGKGAEWEETAAIRVSGLIGEAAPYNGLYYPGRELNSAPSWVMHGVASGFYGSIYYFEGQWNLAVLPNIINASGVETSNVLSLAWPSGAWGVPILSKVFAIAGHPVPAGSAELVASDDTRLLELSDSQIATKLGLELVGTFVIAAPVTSLNAGSIVLATSRPNTGGVTIKTTTGYARPVTSVGVLGTQVGTGDPNASLSISLGGVGGLRAHGMLSVDNGGAVRSGSITEFNISTAQGIHAMPVSHLTSLTNLILATNRIATFDGTGLNALTSLSMSGNSMRNFTRGTGLSALTFLSLHTNNLTTFTGEGLSNLTTLLIYGNQLTTLDVSALVNLTQLEAQTNKLTSFTLPDSAPISTLKLHNNNLAEVDSILIALAARAESLDIDNGIVWLYDGTNAAPTVASSAALSTLSGRGWTVLTN